jgi:hypothetical protein
MGYSEFAKKFKAICEDHTKEQRVKAFAFIFYDAIHGTVRDALKQADGFKTLNEVSNTDLTLFYLHSDGVDKNCMAFNRQFIKELGVSRQVQPPCIVFFRVWMGNIEDVSFDNIDIRTTEPHMVIEELRRKIVGNIQQQKTEGDLSGLFDIGKLLPIGKFLARM